MNSFFVTHKDSFKLEPTNGGGFRKCQLGAIWATKSHFTSSSDPALISLPTGAGKTAIMAALAFEFSARNILIITPSTVIKDQIADEFLTMRTLRRIHAFEGPADVKPRVKVNNKECSTTEIWQSLKEEFDVIVATPNTTSSLINGVVAPPPDLFDIVFFDEAHHAPSATWNALIEQFSTSKLVLLTATPFRRDKKIINAKLVYHYSIPKAIEDRIYRPVTYLPVNTNNLVGAEKDRIIIENTVRTFNDEIQINSSAKLFIKTDRVVHAEELVRIYEHFGITVSTVHSEKTDKQNKDAIKRCKDNEIQGLICVGMAGEGVDIPDLKIAVLHAIPRTLPFTIQLIGRISRANNIQTGNAYLIADPNDVKGEVKTLYRYDRGWETLIPGLIERRIHTAEFLPFHNHNYSEIDPQDIDLYFSVKIYRTTDSFEFKNSFREDIPSGLELLFCEQSNDNSPVIIITACDERPLWGKKLPLSSKEYDLHIFYKRDNLLFENTTSTHNCNRIKASLFVADTYKNVDKNVISKALSDATESDYYMIGMENTTGVSKSNPKFKTYIGSEVQSSLRISDGRVFSFGHALAKIGESETRGVSIHNSRIWSLKRKGIDEFIEWCDNIYTLINDSTPNAEIPQMGVLTESQIISELHEDPILIVFNDNHFYTSIVTFNFDGLSINNSDICFGEATLDRDSGIITSNILYSDSNQILNQIAVVHFNLTWTRHWIVDSQYPININVGFEDEVLNFSLAEYLNEYPPLIILASGQTLKNNVLYKSKVQTERFDQSHFKSFTWDDTDVHRESKQARFGYTYNVQQKTIELISPTLQQGNFLIDDDRANEIADVVVIRTDKREIEFYHCKYKVSDGREPGADKSDITELVEQCLRTGHWIYSVNLIDRLINRIEGNSELVVGDINDLKVLGEDFYPNLWKYKVILVQPGIKKESVFRGNRNIEKLLCTLYDRTLSVNADFEFWGS